jgi:hypothetical protein
MPRYLGLIGIIVLVGCNGALPAPNSTPPSTTANTTGESGGREYTLLVPNMT